jgi:hypothetical protein
LGAAHRRWIELIALVIRLSDAHHGRFGFNSASGRGANISRQPACTRSLIGEIPMRYRSRLWVSTLGAVALIAGLVLLAQQRRHGEAARAAETIVAKSATTPEPRKSYRPGWSVPVSSVGHR